MTSLPVVQQAISDVFGVDATDISTDTVASDVDGWDSLNHVTLLVMLSRRTGVMIDPGEIELSCVGDLVALIDSRLSNA